MQTVMEKIISWAKDLPYWEQMTLDLIIKNEPFTSDDYDTLLQLLLEEEGLAEPKADRWVPGFYQYFATNKSIEGTVRLKQISNLQNVNALAPKQVLSFGPSLTAVYGRNGSGKSGYARVLASAAFTRGDRQVLPDVTKPKSSEAVACADIEICKDGVDSLIHYQVCSPCSDLASFYVFDSTSVRVHMAEQNPLSFSPAGLYFLTRLSDETDQIRYRLAKKIEECNKPCEYLAVFQGESPVAKILASLGPDTDVLGLEKLAHLNPSDKRRRSELAIEIANLELEKYTAQREKLRKDIGKLRELLENLDMLAHELSDVRVEEINHLIEANLENQKLVDASSITQFATERFAHTGSQEWKTFIETAKKLAELEVGDGKVYPGENDFCLLCHQPLSVEAKRLIEGLWGYVKGQSHVALSVTRKGLQEENDRIRELPYSPSSGNLSWLYETISEYDRVLSNKIEEIVTIYQKRADDIAKNLSLRKASAVFPLPIGYRDPLLDLIVRLEKELEKQDKLNIADEVKRLEDERRELDHRIQLEPLFPKIKDYVQKLQWARAARTIGGNTKHITQKHNELFKELVTDEYIKLFGENLKMMGRPLKVSIKTTGRKGSTLRQIVIEAASDAKDIAKPDKVLSEGEKRAVALADFLTEVEVDTNSNGIILDDPVTSLDLDWRETIAEMLVKKADTRQVIIFTHDLPFLYHLKKKAEAASVPLTNHWIKRGEFDSKPGYVYLNNSPALEREYRKTGKARELYQKAKTAPPELQEGYVREGFGALRTSFEAFIIFDLLNEVVMRFDDRISFGRLKDVCRDGSLINNVIQGCERLSRFIEGHSHSDAFSGGEPSPEVLLEEIEKLEQLQKSFRQAKN